MLQAIRTRAGGIIVKILFGLLIISFGFWGIYTRSDYYQGHSPDTVVATVGDQDIRAEELQRALEPALERLRSQFGGSFDQQQVKQLGILDNLLTQLIDRDLLNQEAARLRLEVSDDVIRNAIYDNPTFKGPDGRFDRGMFNQLLAMNRLTEDQLVARLRSELPRTDMLRAITGGISAPRPVIEALYRYRGEKRLADIVAFPVANAADPGQPSEADLGKFYDAHQDLFRAPEYRGFTVAALAPADIVKPGDIPEDKLREEYQQRKEEFETPEQRDVQQILAPSEDKAKEAEAALDTGKDWKEVATTIAGQDPETIDLGLMKRTEMPHELADIAFELPLNRASDPVKSPLGWHILRVVKIEPPTTQSFEQVKPQIEAELQQQAAVDRLEKIGNQLDDTLAGGTALAEAAGKFGLKVTTVAAADLGGNDPDGKAVALPAAKEDILKTVFATEKGDTGRVIETQDGSIFAVHVDKVVAPQVRPLAEVKDKAVAAWQAAQKREAIAKQAEDLKEAVKPDLPLAKAAAAKRLTVTASPSLSRSAEDNKESPVSPGLVAKLFAAKPGDVVTASDAAGAFTAQLKEIQTPETPPDAALAGLSDQLAGEQRQDIAGEFTAALRRRYPVDIKRDALDRMF
jgi:peptidyl-prolyl cis-trans isomerase D